MNSQVIITLIIVAFMMIMLLTHKLPYGITAMICCALFVLTGVSDLKTAFSGLSSKTTIMVASMMVVASQLSRTSIVKKLRSILENMQGKSKYQVMLAMFLVTIALSQLLGQVACLSIMILFVQTLDENSELSPARMLFAVCTLNTIWTSKIPIGQGATMPPTINAFFEGVAPEYAIGLFDYMKAGLIPGIVGLIYCIVFFKLIPHQQINKEETSTSVSNLETSRRDEMIIYACLALIMISFCLPTTIISSDIQNTLPVAAVLFMLVTKVVDKQTVIKTITGDIIWLVAGMQAVSTILSNTGVGELIGQGVLNILGGHPAPILVIAVFTIVTSIITNFMSNIGTMALMIPIAASTALAGGFNVQTVVLVTAVASWMAFVLPTGCSASMIAFGTGNFNAADTLKFTIPLYILEVVTLIISATIFFPIYS